MRESKFLPNPKHLDSSIKISLEGAPANMVQQKGPKGKENVESTLFMKQNMHPEELNNKRQT